MDGRRNETREKIEQNLEVKRLGLETHGKRIDLPAQALPPAATLRLVVESNTPWNCSSAGAVGRCHVVSHHVCAVHVPIGSASAV